ncbi:electron transporter SenC [Iodidimonas nitroreducens]|uniref:Electron transporter SenC n=1 Tax=Iodidimonas nitroreducens TaxID=1236968 RepID=A0A5A7N310_9PROT|nr:SCO family protein [Iodidimonas nitroreducens]GAK32180.1 hypothetical protein AQ1_00042 [alpha proteobacterium Q-1]GER02661.1 electron transporter SenC [Iodidimonas nitroreducens]
MTLPRILIAALIVCLGALGLLLMAAPDSPDRASKSPVADSSVPIGGPFALVSHQGDPVTDTDFRGRYLLIYFGYSYCPDVCPTELAKMTRALDVLEAKGLDLDPIQPLFISVDPERDTVAQMAQYVTMFHPRLIGLTGTPEQVQEAKDAYRIYSVKSGDVDSDQYLVDHASMILLMDQNNQFMDFFSSRESADEIAATLAPLLPPQSANAS